VRGSTAVLVYQSEMDGVHCCGVAGGEIMSKGSSDSSPESLDSECALESPFLDQFDRFLLRWL
jgi:hypothetical protein